MSGDLEEASRMNNPKVPLWKQRRFQFAVLGLVVVAGAAVAVGLVVPRSVGNAITAADTDPSTSNAFQDSGGTLGPLIESSSAPSMVASSPPSLAPSTPPSISEEPSIAPSTTPTSVPSRLPSRTPTISPSNEATKAPSASATPTVSAAPSVPPPSQTPTASFVPTTGLPSLLPSQLPSKSPSLAPTTAAPSLSAVPSVSVAADETFGFYLMGDIPYAPWEEGMLNDQIANITKTRRLNTHFTVHVGDIQKPARTSCVPNTYTKMHRALVKGPLPTFVVPGDNDWFDCPEPEESLELFRDTLTYLEDDWYASPSTVFPDDVVRMMVSHNEEYPELFTFTHHGILFVSIHLIDTKPTVDSDKFDDDGSIPEGADPVWDEWTHRMAANIDWFWKAMGDYATAEGNGSAPQLKAVVMFGHGQISADTKEFFQAIRPAFFSSNPRLITLPILYLHGDGHKWDIDDRIRNQLSWPSFLDVQVDQGAFADPCIVEIATNPNTPLTVEYENQYVFVDGLFRIDRQRGRYPARG